MLGFLKQPKPVAASMAVAGKPKIAAFGKLPIRADFIKLNVVEREIRELDGWVQEGYALISRRLNGAQGEQAFPSAGIHHLVFSATEERRPVLATIGPGSDQSGRWYPFLISTVTQIPYLKETQAAVPVVYQRFYQQSASVIGQRWKTEPLDILLGCLETIAGECHQDERSQAVKQELGLLRATSVDCIHELAAAYGDTALFYQGVCDLLANVMRRGPARTGWGIRLPLPGGEHGQVCLVFWLRLIDSLLGGNWSANYFWRWGQEGAQGQLILFFRRVPPSFLPYLFDPTLRDGNVQTLSDMLKGTVTPSQRARDLAALEQGSLLDLLSRFVSGGRL